jgi:Gas vesicle protein
MSSYTDDNDTAALSERRVAIVDLLDRVLACGVVVTGEVTLSIADVDLVRVSLRTLITSISGEAEIDAQEGRAASEHAVR